MQPDTNLFLWHTTPLFHVPYLLGTGALLSAARLSGGEHPICPRPSAIRRKTKLGLADFVHLSPTPRTPLLRDKQAKGYTHVLLSFDRTATLALPDVALLRFNTKRWAHRDDFVPVRGHEEKAAIWAAHESGKFPSLEVLIPQALPLIPFAAGLHVARSETAVLLETVIKALRMSAPPLFVSPDRFPLASESGGEHDVATLEYFAACRDAGEVLPPPPLPFD